MLITVIITLNSHFFYLYVRNLKKFQFFSFFFAVEGGFEKFLLFIIKNMIPLFSTEEFNNAKTYEKLKCKCTQCGSDFFAKKSLIQMALKNMGTPKINFCSKQCVANSRNTKIKIKCKNCNKYFYKKECEINKLNIGNNFCSKSCSASYNNKNKKYGTRRSKLEIWIESNLSTLYPNLKIMYNSKKAIGSELDIYIPSLKFAFELDGLLHFKPIFGINKLEKIQKNDKNKIDSCIKKQIKLIKIDASFIRNFNTNDANKVLNIIVNHINFQFH